MSPLQANNTRCRPRRLTGLCRSGSLLSGSEGSRWSCRMQLTHTLHTRGWSRRTRLSLKEVLPAGSELWDSARLRKQHPRRVALPERGLCEVCRTIGSSHLRLAESLPRWISGSYCCWAELCSIVMTLHRSRRMTQLSFWFSASPIVGFGLMQTSDSPQC